MFEGVELKFDDKGLIPAIAQDAINGEVLMMAYMNEQSLAMTIESGYATYFSRSRKQLWKKGETSGHLQKVVKIAYDCDCDCILLFVEQTGAACHTQNRSCFYRNLKEFDSIPDYKIVFDVANTIKQRKENPVEGSYTNYLLDKGVEKICKKIGEEATETVIASIANKNEEVKTELSDLLYHALVLMEDRGVDLLDIFAEMEKREGRPPNPKYGKK